MVLQRGPYAHAVHKHTATSRTLTSPLNSCSLRRPPPTSLLTTSPLAPHPSHRVAPTIMVVLDAMRGNTMRDHARRPRGMVCAFSRTYVRPLSRLPSFQTPVEVCLLSSSTLKAEEAAARVRQVLEGQQAVYADGDIDISSDPVLVNHVDSAMICDTESKHGEVPFYEAEVGGAGVGQGWGQGWSRGRAGVEQGVEQGWNRDGAGVEQGWGRDGAGVTQGWSSLLPVPSHSPRALLAYSLYCCCCVHCCVHCFNRCCHLCG